MQWLIAFIAMIIGAIANENWFEWGILGFFIGYSFKISRRLKALEFQVEKLTDKLTQLKNSTQAEPQTKPSKSSGVEKTESTHLSPHPSPVETEEADTSAIFIRSEQLLKKPEPALKPEIVKETETIKEAETVKAEPEEDDFWEKHFPEPTPRKPSDIEKLFKLIWRWFIDGNTFVRVGIVVLFLGVSFLLNLAIESGLIPIGLRLTGVAAFAISLLIIGWKLRQKRSAYALLIQGGAVGLLYLVIFASFNLYHILPAGATFVLLVVIVVLATTLAILQDALSLALFASIGGFLAPIFSSSGSNNFIGLFSFYALLNAGIFAIAWFKAWRLLNLVGFFFTFSIAIFWGASRYKSEYFSTIEPFLILFFLFYVAIPVLYAKKRVPKFKDYIDGSLIFGTPIIGFGLQASLVNKFEYGIAISAFLLGVFYLSLAAWIWKKMGDELRFLSEAFLAVCVIFITIAIPFAVDGSSTSSAWAVEGTAILWVSIRQQQIVQRIFSLLLQAGAFLALLTEYTYRSTDAFANRAFIGAVILSLCAGLSAWMLSKEFPERRKWEAFLSPLLLIHALLWWFIGFEFQFENYASVNQWHKQGMLLVTAFTTASLGWLGQKLQWRACRNASLNMLIPLAMIALATLKTGSHPSDEGCAILWLIAFAVYFFAIKQAAWMNATNRYVLYVFTLSFLYLLVFWEGFWQLLLFATVLSLVFNFLSRFYDRWQMQSLALGLLPVMLFLGFASLFTESLHPFLLPDRVMGVSWNFEAGYVLWFAAFGALYWLFYLYDEDYTHLSTLAWWHSLALLLAIVLSTWEFSWHLSHYLPMLNGWHIALFPVTAQIALWLIMQANIFPFKQHYDDYRVLATPFIIGGLVLWSWFSLYSAGSAHPLPWIPFINPVELMQVIVLITLVRLYLLTPEKLLTTEAKHSRYRFIAVFIFIWLNIVLLRTLHHWGDFVWSPSILGKPATQTSLSIFWTLSGLVLTLIATQKQSRKLWIAGAGLLTIVIIKLFVLDLSSHGSVERIISFITVGGLLMLIGYFAPLPPSQQNES